MRTRAGMSEENPCPRNIFLLCKQYGLELEDLRLLCVYCRRALSDADVLAFAIKELSVVWRKGFPFGACGKCLIAAGKLRQYRHWHYSCYGDTVETETGIPIPQLFMRCYICHKPLSWEEKEALLVGNKRFHNISGRWTGHCMQCGSTCTAPDPASRTLH
ncbi:early protein, partial [human papillomavirus 27]|uniref:Protein E6 n=2 Tax=Alphapapillomavirus 4 TaxID=337043 RepID=VE6_HPV27